MENTLSKKYDNIIKEILNKTNRQKSEKDFKGMKLEGLRYTNVDAYAVRFNKECLPGSEYLILINKIMEDLDLNYCLLQDASKIDMPIDVLEQLRLKIYDNDSTLSANLKSDLYDIFRSNSKISIELSTLKLYEKNFTFYESYGFIPINVNVKKYGTGETSIYYLNDKEYLPNNYDDGNICQYTDSGKTFKDNTPGLIEYITNLKGFRDHVKTFKINLKNFNKDVPEDDKTNYPIIVNKVITKLRDSIDFTAEILYIRSALDKLLSEKNILIKLNENDFIFKNIEFLMEFIELFGHQIPYHHFAYYKDRGTQEQYIYFIEAYLNLLLFKTKNNISFHDTREDINYLCINIERILKTPIPAPRKGISSRPTLASLTDISSRPRPKLAPPALPSFYEGITQHIVLKMKDKINNKAKLSDLTPDKRDCIIKTLENKSHFSDAQNNFMEEYITNTNTDFKDFFNQTEDNNEEDFQAKIGELEVIQGKLKGPQNLTEDDIINIIHIFDTIRFAVDDYIISVDSFCKCITLFWDICRLTYRYISINIDNYETEKEQLKLSVRICIEILNRLFTKNDNYIGNYIGLNEYQDTDIPELNYLCDSLKYDNIKFKKSFCEDVGRIWGQNGTGNNTKLTNSVLNTHKEIVKNNFVFSFDYLYYSVDSAVQPSEDSYCIIIEFKYANNSGGSVTYGGGNYKLENSVSTNKYELIGGADYQSLLKKYVSINPFINIITNNSVILGKKIIEIVKHFTGNNESKSYYEVIEDKERERYEDLKKLVIVNGEKNFLKEELETMFYNNVKIKIKAYRKIFKQLYLEYTLDKNKIKVTIVILSFLREYLDIYFRQIFEEREIMSEDEFQKKLEFYKFLKVKYGLK